MEGRYKLFLKMILLAFLSLLSQTIAKFLE
jgi:hypothetical protein